jgi:hypothetical protein
MVVMAGATVTEQPGALAPACAAASSTSSASGTHTKGATAVSSIYATSLQVFDTVKNRVVGGVPSVKTVSRHETYVKGGDVGGDNHDDDVQEVSLFNQSSNTATATDSTATVALDVCGDMGDNNDTMAQEPLLNFDEDATADGKNMSFQEDGKDDKNVSTAPPDTPLVRLVPPGRIVHLFKENGIYRASELSHEHPTFRTLSPCVERGVTDHYMSSYWSAYRAIVVASGRYNSVITGGAPDRQAHVTGGAGAGASGGAGVRQQARSAYPPVWQSIRRARSTSRPASASATAGAGAGVNTSAFEDMKCSDTVEDTGELPDTGGSPWTPCCVCQLDCTWAYILHSEASRALVTHHCR